MKHQLFCFLSNAVPEYCCLCRLISGMTPKNGPSVFPIDLQTVLGDALRPSPSTVGSLDWSQEISWELRRIAIHTLTTHTPSIKGVAVHPLTKNTTKLN